jgi:hypothetical protein
MFVIYCYTCIRMTARQRRIQPYRRCILMWDHRSICCGTVVLLLELVINFYCLMFVLYTLSAIVRYFWRLCMAGNMNKLSICETTVV